MKVPAGNRSPAEAPASQKGTMTSINPPRPSLCTAMALLKHAIAACSDTRAISWREKRSLQGSRCGVGGHVPTKSSGCRATPGATADGRSGLPGHVRVHLSRSAPRLRGPVQGDFIGYRARLRRQHPALALSQTKGPGDRVRAERASSHFGPIVGRFSLQRIRPALPQAKSTGLVLALGPDLVARAQVA